MDYADFKRESLAQVELYKKTKKLRIEVETEIIDGSDKKIADAGIDTSKRKDVKTLTLNSMQSAIGDDDTYIGIMESNLKVLKEALN